MNHRLVIALSTPSLIAVSASAALPTGAKAPDFTTQASLAGKPFQFSLDEALKKGPVVLYFFPAAFTQGCTIEAHEFAEAADEFAKQGATLIGLTAGNADRITEFSSVECRNKFAVGVATPATITGYDVTLPQKAGWSNRTSFVIAPDHSIIFEFSALDPAGHVEKTLAAVKAWRARHPAA
jgi:peroxiredoxin